MKPGAARSVRLDSAELADSTPFANSWRRFPAMHFLIFVRPRDASRDAQRMKMVRVSSERLQSAISS